MNISLQKGIVTPALKEVVFLPLSTTIARSSCNRSFSSSLPNLFKEDGCCSEGDRLKVLRALEETVGLFSSWFQSEIF